VRIWIYECEAREKNSKTIEQRTKQGQTDLGKPAKAASEEQHHEDKEGFKKIV